VTRPQRAGSGGTRLQPSERLCLRAHVQKINAVVTHRWWCPVGAGRSRWCAGAPVRLGSSRTAASAVVV